MVQLMLSLVQSILLFSHTRLYFVFSILSWGVFFTCSWKRISAKHWRIL